MSLIFTKSNRLVESDYRVKPYFSDQQSVLTLKDKCFVCILAMLGCLFTMNIIVYTSFTHLFS